jgi:hypothetical protein
VGLNLIVGVLDAVDEEAREAMRGDIARLNRFLAAAQLDTHVEPEGHPDGVWDAQMWGYTGLHLRRLAAHLRDGRNPKPFRSDSDPTKDKLVKAYYRDADWYVDDNDVSFHESSPHATRPFDHLILHMDDEGFYVPQRFSGVLMTYTEGDEGSQPVGSSQMLKEECEYLADWLELPLDLDPEAEAVWDAAENGGGSKDPKWKRFGVESFTCLRLHRGASESVQSSRLLVFA